MFLDHATSCDSRKIIFICWTFKLLFFLGKAIHKSMIHLKYLFIFACYLKIHEFKCPRTCPSWSSHKIMCPEIISQYYKILEHRYTQPSKSGEDNNIIISVDFKLLMTENPKHFILVLTLEKSIKAF